MFLLTHTSKTKTLWNKGKLYGQKPLLKFQEIWTIWVHLQMANNIRN